MRPKKLGSLHGDFFHGVSGAHANEGIFARQSFHEDSEESWTGKHFGNDFVGMPNAAPVTAGEFLEYFVRHLSGKRRMVRYSGSSIMDSGRTTTTTPLSETE